MKKPSDDFSDFSDLVLTSPAHVVGGAPDPSSGSATGSPVAIPAEALEAEAAVAASGSGGPDSTVAVTGSAGLTINLMFDAAAMAAPQSFRDGVTQAMAMICAVVTDPITINLQIDYSGTGGGAAGGPSGGFYEPYSTVRADLVNNASAGDTTFNSLPTGSSIAGQTQVAVWYSQLKLWGLVSATGTEVDGSATFATDINPNLLVGVALHELTHAMGRVPYGPPSGSEPDIFDFYRFTSPGNILIDGNSSAPPAYFSLDGGVTKIADYGQNSDPSDFLNSGLAGPTDPFDEFYSSNTQQQLTALDLQQLDALGFHLATNTSTVIEAKGVTELVQVGSNYFLNPVAGGTGPELLYQGSPVVAGAGGSYAGWTVIGAEATSTGFEVAWHNATSNQYTFWYTDSSGNFVTNPTGAIGNGTTVETYETSFHQDLNGDGVIGVPAHTGPAPTAPMTSTEPSGGFNFRPDLGGGQYAADAPAVADATPFHPLVGVQANALASLADAAQFEHSFAIGGPETENTTAKIAHLDHFLFG
jgi:serralysin